MAKKWIAGAIKHPGALKAKAKAAGESTRQFAESHKGAPGATGKQSRLALTLMGMHHDGAQKTEARGGNKKPAHKIYPHLD